MLRMKLVNFVTIAATLFVAASSCLVTAETNYRQVGNFKDSSKNRVFTVEMDAAENKSIAMSYAKSRANTPGQITAVYMYKVGSIIPADAVTMAGSIFEINEIIYEASGLDKWRYAYMKGMSGNEIFVDCRESPKNDLCKQ